MALVSDRCICLRRTEYSETSQILWLLARRHGLIRAIAKGAHRRTKAGASRFDGGVDLLDLGDAVFTHDPSRDLGILTEWKLVEGHLHLRRSLRGICLAQYAAELVTALMVEHDPHPGLFDALEHCLGGLATPSQEESFLCLVLDLLRQTGHLADLSGCVHCGRAVGPDNGGSCWFSPGRGGFICAGCTGASPDRMRLDGRLHRLLQGLLRLTGSPPTQRAPLPRLTRFQSDPINRLLASYIQHLLGKRLRLAEYVLGTL